MYTYDFMQELKRGKGSCIRALEDADDRERYKPVIYTAVTRSTAFDQQCEGTRAGYVHKLVSMMPHSSDYLNAAITAFKDASPIERKKHADRDPEKGNCLFNPCPTDEDFHFLAELLAFFAQNESFPAKSALIHEYDRLYFALKSMEERPEPFFPERDEFEMLAITLASFGISEPIVVIRDIGALFLENKLLKNYDFDEFHELVGKYQREKLKKETEDEKLKAYVGIYYPEFCRNPQNIEQAAAEEETEDLIHQFLSNVDKNPDHIPAPAILKSDSKDVEALIAVIERSDNAVEREKAFNTLATIKSERLKAWAINYLETRPIEQLPILITNYDGSSDDEFELSYQLKQIEVDDKDFYGWHYLHTQVLAMENPPLRALYFIYDKSFCPVCRFKAIKHLAKAKALTVEIITDALNDCYEDTREFIRSLL